MKRAKLLLFGLLFVTGCYTCAISKRTGATCWDGAESGATGSGACSHHHGVRNWHNSYWWDR